MSKETQDVLPGLEGYVCNFKCLTECPLAPDGGCYYDDPSYPLYPLDLIEYPEFEIWQEMHEELVKPEPEDPVQPRCPRCLSIQVTFGYPYIECTNCGYNEPVIDFSENLGYQAS